MRLSFFPSLALHIGAIAVFLPAMSDAWQSEAPPMMILPVELLEIADTTNITAASEAVQEEEEPEAAPTPAEAAPPPPPPEPEEEILPTEDPPPKKQPEQKKPEPKQEKQDFDSTLQDILKAARNAPAPAPKKATPDASAASEGAPRMSAGDRRRMTMTVGDAILQQLIAKGCWNSQADMADARRLRAVIAVRFGRDGHFLAEPRLVEPTREPSNDPPLQVYIQRARSGLAKCNQLGFQVPEQYFEVQPPQTIELDFRPCRAGEC